MSKQLSVLSFFKNIEKTSDSEQPVELPVLECEERNDMTGQPSTSTREHKISASLSNGDPALGVESADIHSRRYQPKDCLKVKKVLSKCRKFKENWYEEFSWLEYSPVKDAAFCFPCRMFCQHKVGRGEESFTKEGVSNWKKALEKFRKHENSEMHLKSMRFWTE